MNGYGLVLIAAAGWCVRFVVVAHCVQWAVVKMHEAGALPW